MTRLVAVSNRVQMPGHQRASGGLAAGLDAALRRRGGLWFGWSGAVVDGPSPGRIDLSRAQGVTHATVAMGREEYRDAYLGFSNSALWPALHGFTGEIACHAAQFTAYQRFNLRFARLLRPLLRADDLVWVHDYQLAPLGRCLRQAGATQPLGFFLHTPFPSEAALRALPVARLWLADLLAYDVVGLQTEADLAAFHAALRASGLGTADGARGVVSARGRRVLSGSFPVGVDVAAIAGEASAARGSAACRRVLRGLVERALIVGADRLDYSKGLVERIAGYAHFLERHAASPGRTSMLQVTRPSRIDLPAYARLRTGLRRLAWRTNARFATPGWEPLRYLDRGLSHGTLMGLLRAAAVGVVTPLRDGMNLVAKEFVAAQSPADPGALVLSAHAGAARELEGALQVEPQDSASVSAAIGRALRMSRAERRERHRPMLDALLANDASAWSERLVSRLASARGA